MATATSAPLLVACLGTIMFILTTIQLVQAQTTYYVARPGASSNYGAIRCSQMRARLPLTITEVCVATGTATSGTPHDTVTFYRGTAGSMALASGSSLKAVSLTTKATPWGDGYTLCASPSLAMKTGDVIWVCPSCSTSTTSRQRETSLPGGFLQMPFYFEELAFGQDPNGRSVVPPMTFDPATRLFDVAYKITAGTPNCTMTLAPYASSVKWFPSIDSSDCANIEHGKICTAKCAVGYTQSGPDAPSWGCSGGYVTGYSNTTCVADTSGEFETLTTSPTIAGTASTVIGRCNLYEVSDRDVYPEYICYKSGSTSVIGIDLFNITSIPTLDSSVRTSTTLGAVIARYRNPLVTNPFTDASGTYYFCYSTAGTTLLKNTMYYICPVMTGSANVRPFMVPALRFTSKHLKLVSAWELPSTTKSSLFTYNAGQLLNNATGNLPMWMSIKTRARVATSTPISPCPFSIANIPSRSHTAVGTCGPTIPGGTACTLACAPGFGRTSISQIANCTAASTVAKIINPIPDICVWNNSMTATNVQSLNETTFATADQSKCTLIQPYFSMSFNTICMRTSVDVTVGAVVPSGIIIYTGTDTAIGTLVGNFTTQAPMQLNATNVDATVYNLCFDTKGVQLTKDTKYWICPLAPIANVPISVYERDISTGVVPAHFVRVLDAKYTSPAGSFPAASMTLGASTINGTDFSFEVVSECSNAGTSFALTKQCLKKCSLSAADLSTIPDLDATSCQNVEPGATCVPKCKNGLVWVWNDGAVPPTCSDKNDLSAGMFNGNGTAGSCQTGCSFNHTQYTGYDSGCDNKLPEETCIVGCATNYVADPNTSGSFNLTCSNGMFDYTNLTVCYKPCISEAAAFTRNHTRIASGCSYPLLHSDTITGCTAECDTDYSIAPGTSTDVMCTNGVMTTALQCLPVCKIQLRSGYRDVNACAGKTPQGSTCTVDCTEGIVADTTNGRSLTLTCTDAFNFTFSDAANLAACMPNCTQFVGITDFPDAVSGDSCYGSHQHNSTCRPKCNDGFDDSYYPSEAQCGTVTPGSWSVTRSNCLSLCDWASAGNDFTTLSSCQQLKPGEACIPSCEAGYAWVWNDGAVPPTCSTDRSTAGAFTADVMNLGLCRRSCKPWVNTTSIVAGTCVNTTAAGEACQLQCAPGYSNDTESFTAECLGSVLTTTLVCKKRCQDASTGAITVAPKGGSINNCDVMDHKQNCTIACGDIYDVINPPRTCIDGNLTGEVQRCELKRCRWGTKPLPPHMTIGTCLNVTQEEYCTFGCESGYELFGEYLWCNPRTGELVGSQQCKPVPPKSCQMSAELTSSYRYLSTSCQSVAHGAECEPVCANNAIYVNDGPHFPWRCNDGVLYNVRPKRCDSSCGMVNVPTHSDGSKCKNVADAQTCVIDCDTGYERQGTPNYVCRNLQLFGSQYCVPKFTATTSTPSTPLYLCEWKSTSLTPGQVAGTCNRKFSFGETCNIACATGYELVGSSERACDAYGNLLGTGFCYDPTVPVTVRNERGIRGVPRNYSL